MPIFAKKLKSGKQNQKLADSFVTGGCYFIECKCVEKDLLEM
jgi:hypothetical protein